MSIETAPTLDPEAIYEIHNCNLGDHWTSFCLMTVLGQRHNRRYKLGTINAGTDYVSRLSEISDLFMDAKYTPMLVQEQGRVKVDAWLNWCFPALMVDRDLRWDLSKIEKYICYQFDGLSADTHKNPTPELEREILEHFESRGYQTIRMGKHLSLAYIAAVMSQCTLFVGCDSGMSHIAHSVGCPVFMYEKHLPTYTCHKLKQSDIFTSLANLREKSQHWLQLLDL